jgi:hypothetical protein
MTSFDIGQLHPYSFVKILFSRPVIDGETSLSFFPQPISAEEAESLRERNSSGYKIIALGINCKPTFELNRSQLNKVGKNECREIFWDHSREQMGVRLFPDNENYFMNRPGFLVILLVKELNLEMKLKRIYQRSISQSKGASYPKWATSLNRFFQIPLPAECTDSLETLTAKLLAKKLVDLAIIVEDEEIVSFLCGKDGTRVVHPVRGRKCSHFQCFDLEVCSSNLSHCLD